MARGSDNALRRNSVGLPRYVTRTKGRQQQFYHYLVANGHRISLPEPTAPDFEEKYVAALGTAGVTARAATLPKSHFSKSRAPNLIYAVQAASGPIKIGIAIDMKKRLQGLQVGHHEQLTLIALSRGGREAEMAFHKKFAEHRIRGEWFRPEPSLLAAISEWSPA